MSALGVQLFLGRRINICVVPRTVAIAIAVAVAAATGPAAVEWNQIVCYCYRSHSLRKEDQGMFRF